MVYSSPCFQTPEDSFLIYDVGKGHPERTETYIEEMQCRVRLKSDNS